MPGTFGSLEIALRSLRSHQRAIEIAGHNVANVNNEAYARQKAVFAATEPYTVPALNREEAIGQIGTGVEIVRIQRYVSDYLNAQYRDQLPNLERWRVLEQALGQMEVILQEPSETGISAALGNFWRAWNELASMPQDLAARTAVVEASSNLAFSIRDAVSRLRELQQDMDVQVRQSVQRINEIAVEIASLNDQISKVQAFGNQPNDLRDRRDALLDELTKIVNVNYFENLDGTITVDIGGHALVIGIYYSQLEAQRDPSNGMWYRVAWQDTNSALVVNGVRLEGGLDPENGALVAGKLGGAFFARDLVVPEMIQELNTLASGLIEAVNGLHALGYGLPSGGMASEGARVASVYPPLPSGAVESVATSRDLARGLGGGTYTLEVRDNGGEWQFRLLDWSGNPVAIRAVGSSAFTTEWQAIPLGQVYETGRGIAIAFGQTGATGTVSFQYDNFFAGRGSSDIDISQWVREDPRRVAAAQDEVASGDNRQALAVAGLQREAIITGGYSADAFYGSIITRLGLSARQALAMTANAEAIAQHLERRKAEVSGVDLDEETADLLRFQRAYQAAARVMTVLDEMLDRLINGTGLVGR